MKFATYWARVKDGQITARGWSDESQSDADEMAKQRLAKIREFAKRDFLGRELDRYSYESDGVICEEIVDEVTSASGEQLAVVSRNSYGALVLNTRDLFIADVDRPHVRVGFLGMLKRTFGRAKENSDSESDATLSRIKDWANRDQTLGVRVYETAAGYRVIITNRTYDAASQSTTEYFSQLKSDPLYIRLCRSQNCFRARLTPKPWRIGIENPPRCFPREEESQRSQFESWNQRYTQAASKFAVCKLVFATDDNRVSEQLEQVIKLHDKLTLAPDRKELA